MRFVETLGQFGSAQRGVFQYKRAKGGVTIDASISNNDSLPVDTITLTNKEWSAILNAIDAASSNIFGLTVNTNNPNDSLYETIKSAVPSPHYGWTWNPSWLAYICAILVHEGTLERYTGTIGQGQVSKVILTRNS